MKKNITFLPDSQPSLQYFRHCIHSVVKKNSCITDPTVNSSQKAPPQVCEKYFNFSIHLQLSDQRFYSFLKKRLLQIWKKQRPLFIVTAQLPPEIAQTRLKTMLNEISPILQTAYHEDFPQPLTPFTLFGWLQTVKLIAQVQEKEADSFLWDEIIHFLNQCQKHQLLNDFLTEPK